MHVVNWQLTTTTTWTWGYMESSHKKPGRCGITELNKYYYYYYYYYIITDVLPASLHFICFYHPFGEHFLIWFNYFTTFLQVLLVFIAPLNSYYFFFCQPLLPMYTTAHIWTLFSQFIAHKVVMFPSCC